MASILLSKNKGAKKKNRTWALQCNFFTLLSLHNFFSFCLIFCFVKMYKKTETNERIDISIKVTKLRVNKKKQ